MERIPRSSATGFPFTFPSFSRSPLRKSKAPVIFIFWRTYWQGKPYKVVFASWPFGIAQGRLQRRGRGIPFINIRALQGEIQIFPGLLNYVRNDDLCKALLFKEVFAQPRDYPFRARKLRWNITSSLTLRMTCRNHRIVILMSLGEEGSRFFSIQNHLCKALFEKEGNVKGSSVAEPRGILSINRRLSCWRNK